MGNNQILAERLAQGRAGRRHPASYRQAEMPPAGRRCVACRVALPSSGLPGGSATSLLSRAPAEPLRSMAGRWLVPGPHACELAQSMAQKPARGRSCASCNGCHRSFPCLKHVQAWPAALPPHSPRIPAALRAAFANRSVESLLPWGSCHRPGKAPVSFCPFKTPVSFRP